MALVIKFHFTSSMLNMFRISSGACDFSIVSPPWLCVLVSMCVGVSMWLGWGGIRVAGFSLIFFPQYPFKSAPRSCTIYIARLFPGWNHPWRGDDHSTPSSAELRTMPSWPVIADLYRYLIPHTPTYEYIKTSFSDFLAKIWLPRYACVMRVIYCTPLYLLYLIVIIMSVKISTLEPLVIQAY